MASKLYVGSLSYNTTDQTLMDTFSQAGAVESVAIIVDRDTGRGKGFGFVEMASEEDAKKAIQMFNNTMLDGRTIVVNEARPRTGGDSRGGGGGSRGGGGGGFRGGGGGYGRR